MTTRLVTELRRQVLDTSGMRTRNTARAFALVPAIPAPSVLDVGCGSGGASVQVAQLSGGRVIGLDLNNADLRFMADRAVRAELDNRVHALCGSMAALGFADETFDIIWCEGATYPIGLSNALDQWRRLIRPSGYLVLHEPVWYQDGPPANVRQLIESQAPRARTVPEYLALFCRHCYKVIGHFALPEDDWWTGYYYPLRKLIAEALCSVEDSPETAEAMDEELSSIAQFEQCRGWYGSAFFILQASERRDAR